MRAWFRKGYGRVTLGKAIGDCLKEHFRIDPKLRAEHAWHLSATPDWSGEGWDQDREIVVTIRIQCQPTLGE